MKQVSIFMMIAFACGLFACSSASNDRAVGVEDLEKVQAEDASQVTSPTRDALTASELIALADCKSLECVQLFMKDHSNDFVHASKGQFAALHRTSITDTAGNTFVMPVSTLYVDVNPQASWRMKHTLHRLELSDQLLKEFESLGFQLADSGTGETPKNKQLRYYSPQYPGKVLYRSITYRPWYQKGLYTNVTWPCYVFEVQ
ncbi:MAG TPA: hypothetical protein VFZ47_11885 [Chitinophagaceae bacterium]